jgi:hypothetical protein
MEDLILHGRALHFFEASPYLGAHFYMDIAKVRTGEGKATFLWVTIALRRAPLYVFTTSSMSSMRLFATSSMLKPS